MADVYLFPSESVTSDIRLRPAEAAPEILGLVRPIRMRRASQIVLMRR